MNAGAALSGLDTVELAPGGTTATFTGSQLTGQTVEFVGSGTTPDELLIVNAGNTGETIDLSNITLTAGVSTQINGGDGVDVITGTAGNDTIIGGLGVDTIIGGGGANTLTGGTGSDTFVLGLTDAGSSIKDFTAGNAGDELDLDESIAAGPTLEKDTGSHIIGDSSTGTVGMFVDTGNDLTTADEAGIEALFGGQTVGLQLQSDGADLYFVASDGADTYVFFLQNEGSDSEFTAAADQATLVATFDGMTDAGTLTADNFVDFA